MKRLLNRIKLFTYLRKIYEETWFKDLFYIDKAEKSKKTRAEEFTEKMEMDLASIEDKELFIAYLEKRIVVYLKDMTFISDSDTQLNRARLLEILAIRDAIERVVKKERKLESAIKEGGEKSV